MSWAARRSADGDYISLDGSTGKIYGEAIPTVAASVSGDFGRLMAWADEARQLQVRTNADTPRDAAQALAFGAQGIGLCRTEHMFFEGDQNQSGSRDDPLQDRGAETRCAG